MNKQITDNQLERYVLGELSPEVILRIDEARKEDTSIEQRIKSIEASNNEILSMYSPEYFGTLVRQRVSKKTKVTPFLTKERIRSFTWVFGSAAVFSLALVFLFPTMLTKTINYDFLARNETTRIKGSSTLLIYRRDGSSLLPGNSVAAGESLQIYYRNDSYRYGAVISIDGRGVVTRHYPLDSDEASELKKSERTILPQSYALDDAPFFEIFYFCYSNEPFDVADIERKLKMNFAADYETMKDLEIGTGSFECSRIPLIKQ